ncbi:MAG: universal stress protein [Thermoanaerobaculia bacterium]
MYPWRRILLPTDFSTASEWVFDDAIRIAGSSGAELIILHIRLTRSGNADQLRFPADPSVYEYAERIELEKLRDRVRRANASVATRLIVKHAPDTGSEISRTATAEAVDLIVIATHARHHVAHLFIGSTTMSVITNPPAPVLAIRYGTKKRQSMRRIVVPVHLLQEDHAALELAAAVARREGSEVHLLTVCDEPRRSAAEKLLESFANGPLSGVSTKRTIVRGTDVEREVVRYVDRSDADALFVNAQTSVSPLKTDIIRQLSAPVMIVPAATRRP